MTDTPDLTVPAFLRGAGTAPKRPRRRRFKPTRPEGEAWAGAERWELRLHDELPEIGSGYRFVWVVIGRKWVRIAYHNARAKITVSQWNQLSRRGKRLDVEAAG